MSDLAWQSARIDRLEELLAERDAKIAEAAAFLDGLANRLDENYADRNYQFRSPQQAATDCRAMAARLRGET